MIWHILCGAFAAGCAMGAAQLMLLKRITRFTVSGGRRALLFALKIALWLPSMLLCAFVDPRAVVAFAAGATGVSVGYCVKILFRNMR